MLFVTIGPRRYRIDRPWGDLPEGQGGVTDVATDPAGRIYVGLRRDAYVSAPAPTVIVLDAEGRRIGAFGEEVADLHMLDVSPDGLVHAVDRDAHEMIGFDAEGVARRRLGRRHHAGQPFNAPCDIAFAPDGTAFVADGYAASRVHVFGPDGAPRDGWGGPGQRAGEFSTPHAVWVGPRGEVAVADRENNRLEVFDQSGRHRRSITLLHKPMAVTADSKGNWWVTDQVPSLSVFSPEGLLVGRARAVLNGAHGMALHPDGSVLLAEMTPSRLTRLVPV